MAMRLIQFLRDYSIVFMAATFIVMLALTFLPVRKQRFERDGQIPLQDDR
jgi:cbb3-type cytochrome oxidase subunit 3